MGARSCWLGVAPGIPVSLPFAAQSVVSEASTGKPHRATAVILLESSSAHTYSVKQEIYVADLKLSGQREAKLTEIVDRYSSYDLQIDWSVLAMNRSLRILATRRSNQKYA